MSEARLGRHAGAGAAVQGDILSALGSAARLGPARSLGQHEHLALGPELGGRHHLLPVLVEVQLPPVVEAALGERGDCRAPPQHAQAAPLRWVAPEDPQGAARLAAGDELLRGEPPHELRGAAAEAR